MVDRHSTRAKTSTAQPWAQRPAAALVVLDPPADRGRSVPVNPDGLLIGRAWSSDLVLTEPAASRKHALVHARGGEYVVDDRRSLNGTYLNGERVTTPRVLHDGDRLRFGRLVAEFRLMDPIRNRPDGRGPGHDPGSRPNDPTSPDHPTVPHRLRNELREAPDFSSGALLLAVLGSVVGAVLFSSLNTVTEIDDQWRTLIGAALGPLISTTFTTWQAGETGRLRTAIIVLLSGAALLVTATGFSITDVVKGSSVLPGVAEGSTLPVPGLADVMTGEEPPEPPPLGPALRVSEEPDCGAVMLGDEVACSPITISSTGDEPLDIGRIEPEGAHPDDFIPSATCADSSLEPGERCEFHVTFRPLQPGDRAATLVISHNAPGGETRVELGGVAEGDPPGTQTDPEVAPESELG